jgi:site-specific DNA recombinase
VRQAKGQLDEHRKALGVEQRQLGKDLKRERASLKRLASGPRNGDALGTMARLAGIQQRIETVEGRLVTVVRDLDSAKQHAIDEGQVAAALSAFDSVWEALVPTEQARILGLLTERIAYDGRTERLELALRPSGIGRLHELQPA